MGQEASTVSQSQRPGRKRRPRKPIEPGYHDCSVKAAAGFFNLRGLPTEIRILIFKEYILFGSQRSIADLVKALRGDSKLYHEVLENLLLPWHLSGVWVSRRSISKLSGDSANYPSPELEEIQSKWVVRSCVPARFLAMSNIRCLHLSTNANSFIEQSDRVPTRNLSPIAESLGAAFLCFRYCPNSSSRYLSR